MSVIYVNNNGDVLPNEGATIAAGNRSYLYGDGIFESIRIVNGKAINIHNHYKRMTEGAKVLKMRMPSFYSAEFFESRIQFTMM